MAQPSPPPTDALVRHPVRPPEGGVTSQKHGPAVYADLPEPLRALADSLRGVHTNDDYAAVRPNAPSAALDQHRKVFTSTTFRTEHPVLRVHPETGERTLILGNFLQKLVGFRSVAGVSVRVRAMTEPGSREVSSSTRRLCP